METSKRAAIAISGLVFAGASALSLGAAAPSNAAAVRAVPRHMISGGGGGGGGSASASAGTNGAAAAASGGGGGGGGSDDGNRINIKLRQDVDQRNKQKADQDQKNRQKADQDQKNDNNHKD